MVMNFQNAILVGLVCGGGMGGSGLQGQSPSRVVIETPMPPPGWALLELELIRAQTAACRDFFDRYFDERGYLECVERWGGDDGPDDAIECVADWPPRGPILQQCQRQLTATTATIQAVPTYQVL